YVMNNLLLRLGAICFLVGIGAVGFCRFACNRPGSAEVGSGLLESTVGEYVDSLNSSTDWKPRVESNHRRIQAKHAVVAELLAGRLKLWEAAARIGELDAEVPGIRDRLAERYPGFSFEVALCREVIEQARSVLRVRAPEQVEKVVAGLETELREYLVCD